MRFPSEREYPKQILVNKTWYTIKFVTKFKGQPLLVGLHDGDTNTITLKRQNKKDMYEVFLHELIHAFEEQFNFTLNHRHVYKLAEALCQYLEENAKPLKSKSKRNRTKKKQR